MASLGEYAPLNESASVDATVIHFTGSNISLDEETALRVGEDLHALADEPGVTDLVLDFSNVVFVSSTALGTLVSLHRKLLAGGRHLVLCGVTPRIHEVFGVTRLDHFLDLRRAGEQGGSAAYWHRPAPLFGVLIVDDEPVIRCLLDRRLRKEGFQVWLAGHGFQAVELYQRHRPEIAVVLLDVLMPRLDGPQTLIVLRQICPAVRCCFMTGNPAPYSEEELLGMGADRVFRKPFPFTEILGTLNAMASRPQRGSRERWIEL